MKLPSENLLDAGEPIPRLYHAAERHQSLVPKAAVSAILKNRVQRIVTKVTVIRP
jgi:hypothetical protein